MCSNFLASFRICLQSNGNNPSSLVKLSLNYSNDSTAIATFSFRGLKSPVNIVNNPRLHEEEMPSSLCKRKYMPKRSQHDQTKQEYTFSQSKQHFLNRGLARQSLRCKHARTFSTFLLQTTTH